ncbi:MAG TPA: SCO family protein [Anaeromyxobacteraceae bacterium]|nr:SCO family protein [Anaeromyxobacteraceae bacterium]
MPARHALAALLLAAAAPALAAEGTPSRPAPAAPAKAAAGEAAQEQRARDYFTDTVLVDQDGRKVRFYSDVMAGKVTCFAFIFTTCNEACPLIMAKLTRVKAELGPLFGGEVQVVAVSVDPDQDTPAALRAFAAKHQAEGPGWTYLTGAKADVAAVLTKLGSWSDDPSDHSTAFIVGNARTRHWSKVRPDAPPQAVAEILRGLAGEGTSGAPATAARGP